jgi:hypothetical protein
LSPRQVFSAFLLIVIIAVILYPTTATGTVRVNADYQQAVIEMENQQGLLITNGVTNLYVSFAEIRIHSANEGNETGWLPITYQTTSLDLAGFADRSGTIFVSPTVPVGEYDNIMLTFSNTTAIANGTTITVESVPKTIVSKYPFTVKAGSAVDLNLKFTADYRALNATRRVFFQVNPMID